jgi:predicted TPR repeat methyltransferase
MADSETTGFLGSVYRAKTPAELANHYNDWAKFYDADMAKAGYRHPAIVLALLARHCPKGAAPLLDAGCGTGLVGEWLGIMGYPDVHGLDISVGMIEAARAKNVYSGFTVAALGTTLPFPDGHFASIIASGVFTTGHVGVDGLDDLIRITKPGGFIVLTVKDALWHSQFEDRLGALIQAGRLSIAELLDPYLSMPNEPLASPTFAVALRVS